MANSLSPFGLRYVRRFDGAAPNLALTTRRIAFNEADTIAKGDLVKQLADGYIELYDAADTASYDVF